MSDDVPVRFVFYIFMTLSATVLACDTLRYLDPECATAHYLRLVQQLVSVRGRLSPEAIEFLAATDEPTNPVEAKLTNMSEAEALPFKQAFAKHLKFGVDWAVVKTALRELGGGAAGDAQKRGVARKESGNIIASKVLTPDLIRDSGAEQPGKSVQPEATVSSDGALYVVVNGNNVNGRQSVIRYENGKAVAVALPPGALLRELVTDGKGHVSVACLTRRSPEETPTLDIVDPATGARKSYGLPSELAAIVDPRERLGLVGGIMPKIDLVETANGRRHAVVQWRVDWKHNVAVIPLDDSPPPKFTPHPREGWQDFSPSNRKRYITYGFESNGQLVVKDQVSGRELLRRPPYERRLRDDEGVWVTEDGNGHVRVASCDKTGKWIERDLDSGAERTVQLPEMLNAKAGYVKGRNGEPVFLVERKLPRRGHDFDYIADGAATAETKRGVAVGEKGLATFTTPLGHFAVGHDSDPVHGVPDKTLQLTNLSTGETSTLPLTPEVQQLDKVHTLPDGRVVATVFSRNHNGSQNVKVVQIYGPAKP